MKIQVISDLHQEFGYSELSFDNADVVVFAGDVNLGIKGLHWIQSRIKDKPVIYVLGNHEYYKSAYTKLLSWFKVPTPLGTYNPDWAILYNQGTEEQLHFVTESKGTIFDEHLRPIEKGKIHCGKEHFKSIGSRMIVAHTIDDVYSQV